MNRPLFFAGVLLFVLGLAFSMLPSLSVLTGNTFSETTYFYGSDGSVYVSGAPGAPEKVTVGVGQFVAVLGALNNSNGVMTQITSTLAHASYCSFPMPSSSLGQGGCTPNTPIGGNINPGKCPSGIYVDRLYVCFMTISMTLQQNYVYIVRFDISATTQCSGGSCAGVPSFVVGYFCYSCGQTYYQPSPPPPAPPPSTGTLSFRVVDPTTDTFLNGVKISIDNGALVGYTSGSGTASFIVQAGLHSYSMSLQGYQPVPNTVVSVSGGQNTQVQIAMMPLSGQTNQSPQTTQQSGAVNSTQTKGSFSTSGNAAAYPFIQYGMMISGIALAVYASASSGRRIR